MPHRLPGNYSLRLVIGVMMLVACAYWLAAYTLPGVAVGEALDGALIALAITIVITYTHSLIRAGASRYVDGAMLLKIGIIGSWSVTAILGGWRILRVMGVYRGGPDVFYTASTLRGFLSTLFILFAAMHVVAIGLVDGRFVRRNVYLAIGSALLGALVTYGMLWLSRR